MKKTISAMIIGTLLLPTPVIYGMKLTSMKPVTDYKKQLTTSVEACDAKQFRTMFMKHRSDINQEPALRTDLQQLALKIKNAKQADFDKEKPVKITPVDNVPGLTHEQAAFPPLRSLTLRDLKAVLPIVALICADMVTSTAAIVAVLAACGREQQNHEHVFFRYAPEMRKRAKLASIILVPSAIGLHYLTKKVTSGSLSKRDLLLNDIVQLDDIIHCINSAK